MPPGPLRLSPRSVRVTWVAGAKRVRLPWSIGERFVHGGEREFAHLGSLVLPGSLAGKAGLVSLCALCLAGLVQRVPLPSGLG